MPRLTFPAATRKGVPRPRAFTLFSLIGTSFRYTAGPRRRAAPPAPRGGPAPGADVNRWLEELLARGPAPPRARCERRDR